MKDQFALEIQSNIHNYQVSFIDSADFLQPWLDLPYKVFVLDRKVYQAYPQLFAEIPQDCLYLLDAEEGNKNLQQVQELLAFLSRQPGKKQLTLISFGGGIVQDITGFAASTLYRGIRWLFVPTTLLAQADSCVGSKTSLNFNGFKNILGGFYPPHQVVIWPGFLASLPKQDQYSGVGEIIKFLLLDDREQVNIDKIAGYAQQVLAGEQVNQAIRASLAVKQYYIAEDEFDTGKRNLFNYGHCFGHALEYASEYRIPHGIAVTIGMLFANLVALQRAWISDDFYQQLKLRLLLPNIPMALHGDDFGYDALLSALKNDKKRVGKDLTLILPSSDKMQAVKINDLTEAEFNRAYQALTAELQVQ